MDVAREFICNFYPSELGSESLFVICIRISYSTVEGSVIIYPTLVSRLNLAAYFIRQILLQGVHS